MQRIGRAVSLLLVVTLLLFPASLTVGFRPKKPKSKVKQKKTKKRLSVRQVAKLLAHHRKMKNRHWNALMQALKKLVATKDTIRRAQNKEHYQLLSSLVRKLRKAVKVHRVRYGYHASKVKRLSRKLEKMQVKAVLYGEASYYSDATSNYGNSITAAMRSFRGKKVKVTNLSNNRSITVLVNDYGPASWTGRVIDLSRASFERVASLSQGVIPKVKLEVY